MIASAIKFYTTSDIFENSLNIQEISNITSSINACSSFQTIIYSFIIWLRIVRINALALICTAVLIKN